MSSIDPAQTSCIRELASGSAYSTRALEAIVRIQRADGPPELLEALMAATAAIGATASVFTASVPESGNEPSSFSVFACHPGFAHEQFHCGPLLNHPWVRFARTHTVPVTGQQLHLETGADEAAIALADRYGFKSCLVVPTPVHAEFARVEMLCVGSRNPGDFEGDGARIRRALVRTLAAELHDWLTAHLSRRLQQDAQLQDDDIALLVLERDGFGTKEISLRTGMSLASVDSRFQRINTRLNCPTRKASAQRAVAYGLLEST